MQIRAAQLGDLETIARLEYALHADAWAKNALLDLPMTHLVIAVQDTKILGYVLVQCVACEMEVLRLGVDASYQRQGIAHALLSHVLDNASANGTRLAFLEVDVMNVPAICLYQRLGFMHYHTRPAYYQHTDGVSDAHLMRLVLVE